MTEQDLARQPRPVDRHSPLPLWAQLHDDLVRRLSAGGFTAGFPGEHELVEEYGVSRHTVREALRRLRQAGVLDSARGRRTAVHHQRIEQPLGALYSLFDEVQARGMRQRSEVLARDLRTDTAVAARLGLDPATEFVHLVRLRFADDEPLATDRTWLLADLARPLLTADLTGTGIYAELATCGVRITDGQERIHATVPTAEQRQLLGIGRSVGLLAVERIGRAAGTPVEWRETFVRGDRFSLLAGWAPHRAYQLQVADGSPLRSAPFPVDLGLAERK
ncbi:GntR family transcriptional regulator [Solwaraspora sp. WMMB335]|uniref:GntR family transcriptional regulator n=1 Tax=Solwaraspora sp. WMMB335 TaxID=3404118 RepID=UPI003B94C8CE